MGIFDKLFKSKVEKKAEKRGLENLATAVLISAKRIEAEKKLWEEGCLGTYDISERTEGMKILNTDLAVRPSNIGPEFAELYAKRAFIKHFSISLEDSADEQNEQDVKEALAIDPSSPIALFVGGAIYSRKKEYQQALDMYGELLKSNPKFEIYTYRIDECSNFGRPVGEDYIREQISLIKHLMVKEVTPETARKKASAKLVD